MRFETVGPEFEGEVIGTSFEYEGQGKAPVVILNLKEIESGNTIFAYLYQFRKDAEVWNKDTQLYGYEQVKNALEWDGTSYDPFATTDFVGKHVKFDTYLDEYNGKQSVKVKAVWHVSGDRPAGLQAVDPNHLKAANARLSFSKPAPTPKAAKAKVTTKANPTSVAAAETKSQAPAVATNVSPPARKAPTQAESAKAIVSTTLASPCSKIAAWLEVSDPDSNGNADQAAVETAWTNAINAIAGADTADEDVTMAQWGEIRAATIAELLPPK